MDTVADMRVGEFSDVLSSKAPVHSWGRGLCGCCRCGRLAWSDGR